MGYLTSHIFCKEIFDLQFKLLNIGYKESREYLIFGIFLGGEKIWQIIQKKITLSLQLLL